MYTYSPLRYPGGKGQLAAHIAGLLEQNNINEKGKYVEPYAGGASVAMYLLLNGYVRNVYINDIDIAIYSFWYSILNNTEDFIKKIQHTEINMQEWVQQKKILDEKQTQKHTLLEIGFATFFLNRTNRSGILKGGVIGGRSQTGPYKMDCRFNKKRLISLIRTIAQHKKHIKLSNMDAIAFFRKYKRSFDSNTLVYLDPPYYQKGYQLYLNSYNPEDHALLKRYLKRYLHCPWMISYDDVDPIKDMYSDFRTMELSVYYSASKHRKGKEIIILGPQMAI